ncbi:MAG: PAS domain S-box protein [Candidatus Zhuqueibacterota bacterium]
MPSQFNLEDDESPGQLTTTIRQLRPGDHLCSIFETIQEHRSIITTFILTGFDRNERVVYIGDDHSVAQIEAYLTDAQVNLASYIEAGQFIFLKASDIYIADGTFEPEKMIQYLKDQTEYSLACGYDALRVSGEMSWMLKGNFGTDQLIQYEAMLLEFFLQHRCLALCQYDKTKFSADVLLDVLRTHPLAIVGDDVYKNFYYLPPCEILNPDRNEAKLKYWLENLKKFNRTEEQLHEVDRRFLTLIKNLPGFVYQCLNDRDWTMNFISEGITNTLGYTVDEMKKMSYAGIIHPNDSELVWDEIQEALHQKQPFRIHYRARTKAGAYRWMLEQGCGVFDRNGELKHLEGFITDVHDERFAKEDRDRFFNLTTDLICMITARGIFKFVNQEWEKVLGYKQIEMVSRPVLNFIHPNDVAEYKRIIRRLKKSESTIRFENRYVHKDGSVKLIEWTATPSVESGLIYCIGRDVTDDRRLHTMLLENERRLRNAQKAGKIGSWEVDCKTETWTVSDEFRRIHGVESNYFSMKKMRAFVFKDDVQLFEHAYRRTVEKQSPFTFEHRIIKQDTREIRWVLKQGELVCDERNRPIQLIGTTQDITDRKQIELALQREKERAQYYLDIVGVMLVVLDRSGQVRLINKKGCAILGYSEAQVIGKNWFDHFLPESNRDEVKHVFTQLMAGKIKTVEYFENDVITSDGNPRLIAWKNSILWDELHRPTGILSSGEDITEKRQAEQQIQFSKKMLSDTGKMAKIGGWEHDLITGKADWTDTLYEIVEIQPGSTPPGVQEHLSYYPPKDRAILESEYQRAIEEKRPFDLRLQAYTATGKLLWCHVRGEPVIENQKCVRFRGVLQDITEQMRIEEALRQSETRYRYLFENASIAIGMSDADGRVIAANQVMEQLTGFSSEEFQKIKLMDIYVVPEDRDRLIATIRKEGKVRNFETHLHRKDGTLYLARLNVDVIRIGGEEMLLTIAQDITESRRMEEALRMEREQLLSLFDSIDEMIYVSDPMTYEMVYVNKKLQRMLNSDGAGETCYRLLQRKEAPCEFCTNHFILSNDHQPYQWEYHNPWLNKDFMLTDRLIRWPDGRDVRFELAIDITDRKIAEAEIQKLNRELEQRVKDRTFELEAVNKELEAFSYSVSHDLRAPLRHISGFVDMLRKNMGETTCEKNSHYLDVIRESAQRMGNLIDELLAFSRTGRSEIAWKNFDADTLIQEVIQELQPEIGARTITWKLLPLPEIYADPLKLRHVFVNLISNAIKFTRQQQNPVIEVSATRGDSKEYVFAVRDNGVGFDMKYANKLFGVFQRLHRTEEFEGNGIGLANVRRIIHRHGGRTWAEGKLNEGATFYFTVPMK